MQMMRERRGGDLQFLLHLADRQPFITRPNERPVKPKARRIAKRLELFCRFFDFHRNSL